MSTQTAPTPRPFDATYRISNDMPGAPLVMVQLNVDLLSQIARGEGKITQAVNPPLEMTTELGPGESPFHRATNVYVDDSNILINLEDFRTQGKLPNVILWLKLSTDWKSGTADGIYRKDGDNWQDLEGVPVTLISGGPQ